MLLVTFFFFSVSTRFPPTIDSTDDFRKYGKMMVDFIADYQDNIRNYKVIPDVQPGYLAKILLNEASNEPPESWESVIRELQKAIFPGNTHWMSPHFHGLANLLILLVSSMH